MEDEYMEWIASITTTSLFGLLLFLGRNLILTRLKHSVKHEYDQKLEIIRNELTEKEEKVKADLRLKETQIDALRTGVLSNIANRQVKVFEKQLYAIEAIWAATQALSPIRTAPEMMKAIHYEKAMDAVKKDSKVSEMFRIFGEYEFDKESSIKAIAARPFVSKPVWAYYSAYKAILIDSVFKVKSLQNGFDFHEFIKSKEIENLVKAALPEKVDYLNSVGADGYYYLLDELEEKILLSIEQMLNGKELDKDTLENAAHIIDEANKIAMK